MKNPLASFPDAGSFVAGFLIGLSIVILMLAVAQPDDWQAFWIIGAPVVLALGLVLQAVLLARPRHRTTAPALGALHLRSMRLSFGR